jgi:iron complex outermembrane receptor protein
MSPGASGYGGTSPEAAGTWSDTSYGVYAGAEGDLTEKLSAGVAIRYEDYKNSGGSTVGKINGLYKVTDTFSVRATVGTGYHAPSPGQSHVSILTTNFAGGLQVQTGTYPVESAISKFYGAKSLEPETANNYGFGFVAKPSSATVVTVDAYQIDVKKRIGISKTFNVSAADIAAQPALSAVGLDGAVTYFTNGFDTRTRGVDIVATHRTELVGGRLNMTVAYNYNQSDVTKFDAKFIDTDQIANVKRLAPNTRVNASANWTRDNWTVNVRENYYGSWRVETDYPGQTFGKKFTTDLDVSYTTAEHYTITVGATNLFNAYPDKIKQSSSNNVYPITGSLADGQIYPRNGGPFGINGAFGYVRLRANF